MKRGIKVNLLLIFISLLLVPACTNAGSETTASEKPIASITSPATNSRYEVGQELSITFNAADVKGIAQVELAIDGEPVLVEPVEPPVNSFAASQRWVVDTPGSHVIEFRAFNVDGVSSDPAQIFVTGIGPDAEPAATESATESTVENTPTPTVSSANPVFPPLPTPTATEEPTAETANDQAVVTAVVRLNVRLGPSTDYPVIGRLDLNQSAPITGRDQFSAWWQIDFASDQGDKGWVAAGSDFSTAINTENVPEVESPPLEAVVEPTATPVPATPTPAPEASGPVIHNFVANRYTIAVGESVELSWDLENAQVALLRYDDVEEGVAAPGSKVFTLGKDTTFTLIARGENGEATAELTVLVGTTEATPIPIYRDGKVRVANAQYLDFDQGLVLPVSDANTDFQWDGQTKMFVPLNGATGTLFSKPYEAITFTDCQTAPYNQPISGVDGSSAVTGCYLTSEGRYGRFVISEWDLAFNLTIEWQTWTYP